MNKVICSNIKCKYLKENKCTCNNVVLAYSNIATVNQGRKDILECRSFKKDNWYKKTEKLIENILNEMKEGENNAEKEI